MCGRSLSVWFLESRECKQLWLPQSPESRAALEDGNFLFSPVPGRITGYDAYICLNLLRTLRSVSQKLVKQMRGNTNKANQNIHAGSITSSSILTPH